MTNSSNNHLIKHSSAIHVSNNLTAIERKISNIILKHAFASLLSKEEHTIQLKDIVNYLGWKNSITNYTLIKDALRNLVKTSIEWNVLGKDKKNIWTATTIISSVSIEDGSGICTYSYSPHLRKLLSTPNIYAKLNLLIQTQISSKHSLVLWEYFSEILSSQKRKNVSTEWIEIKHIKKLLGVEKVKGYDELKFFNRDILKKSINEINKVSDLYVEYLFKKEGRKVTHISFEISRNKEEKEIEDFEEKCLSKPDVNVKMQNEEQGNPSFEFLRNRLNYSEAYARNIIKKYKDRDLEYVIDYVKDKNEKGKIKNIRNYFRKIISEYEKESNIEINLSPTIYSEETSREVEKEINILDKPWKDIVKLMINQNGIGIYISWLSKLKFVRLRDGIIIFKTDSRFIRDWMKEHHKPGILRAAKEINSEIFSMEIELDL